eukprot:2302588-Rhodomonas_salina.1
MHAVSRTRTLSVLLRASIGFAARTRTRSTRQHVSTFNASEGVEGGLGGLRLEGSGVGGAEVLHVRTAHRGAALAAARARACARARVQLSHAQLFRPQPLPPRLLGPVPFDA